MCTMITRQAPIKGSGKGRDGWFELSEVNVSYDHPFNAPFEHAVNIDFVDQKQGPGARVAVELSVESARNLIKTIEAALAEAQRAGHLEAEPAK
ncbi:MAG TPA: DUF6295 family protein [Candidatus Acidoferrales bacterium]|nr:DUF6295 family protein [Candidatus Acidoferrales bacterium]